MFSNIGCRRCYYIRFITKNLNANGSFILLKFTVKNSIL